MNISIHENGLYMEIYITEEGDVRLCNFSSQPQRFKAGKWNRLVELQISGYNQNDHHGSKHTGTQPGSLLRYKSHALDNNNYGLKLELAQTFDNLTAVSHVQFYDGIPVIRSWTEITNDSQDKKYSLEHISSFTLTGIESGHKRDENAVVYIPHSTWFGECQWKKYTLKELGYDAVHESFSMKRISKSSSGSWPCSEYLPMGCFEAEGDRTITWQIETSAAWGWEISDIDRHLYVSANGPSYQEHGFVKRLNPGEFFVSDPCAVCFTDGGFYQSIRELTRYRRKIRNQNEDNKSPYVIFNDYMNCLMGDPTEEKEYPLIDVAAEAGCKYYCIDCGWYSDGEWWDGVGEWMPSLKRFPNGIKKTMDYIRSKGMIPGLWLELEVMGIECPIAKNAPKDWFFQRSDQLIVDHSRYQLDFRNPEVRRYADACVDRLVAEYGVGYIKMDYNINAGAGTEYKADSAAEGLLEHTRAYLDWLQRVYRRYPDLIIENCGSGGMRMAYPLLSSHSIQSVTDQTDYLKMAPIACNCMTAVPPEQAAIWSYPLSDGDEEEIVFNMVNSMLFCIHQSGHLAELPEEGKRLICEGIKYHKAIAPALASGLPSWPLGLGSMGDDNLCAGIDCGRILYFAVWRIADYPGKVSIPLNRMSEDMSAFCAYPQNRETPLVWNPDTKTLEIEMRGKTARIIELRS